MTDSTVVVEAPGKLVLLGEYAVLEGAPALVTSVNRKCYIQLKARQKPDFIIEAANLNMPPVEFRLDEAGNPYFNTSTYASVRKQLTFALSILRYVSRKTGQKIPGANIRIDTAEFFHKESGKKLGLGSSAALTVALMSALIQYLSNTEWLNDLFCEALKAHRNAQGRMGSGVDIAASTVGGGLLKYSMPSHNQNAADAIKNVTWPEDLFMVPVWTGYSVSTRSLIRKVQAFRDDSPSIYEAIMGDMHRLSKEGCKAMQRSDAQAFIDVTSEFIDRERMLTKYSNADIISGVHEQISNLIEAAGGSYKPSGAGGGDIGVAYCNTPEAHHQIIEEIEQSPFEVLDLSIQTEGVKPILPYEIN